MLSVATKLVAGVTGIASIDMTSSVMPFSQQPNDSAAAKRASRKDFPSLIPGSSSCLSPKLEEGPASCT